MKLGNLELSDWYLSFDKTYWIRRIIKGGDRYVNNIILIDKKYYWVCHFYGLLEKFMKQIHKEDNLIGNVYEVQKYIDDLLIRTYKLKAFI